MADTEPTETPAETTAAPAPAPAPVEEEPTPGADVNTGPSENLREVSLWRSVTFLTIIAVFCSSQLIIHL